MTEGFTKAEKARERIYPLIQRLGEQRIEYRTALGDSDNTADGNP